MKLIKHFILAASFIGLLIYAPLAAKKFKGLILFFGLVLCTGTLSLILTSFPYWPNIVGGAIAQIGIGMILLGIADPDELTGRKKDISDANERLGRT